MALPVVAVVGRPNVGKSTFFNKIAGSRLAIVEDTPGVTRDRIYYETEWNRKRFMLVDTGGIEPKTDDEIFLHMRDQTQIAIDTADVIVFMTDMQSGLTADDRDIAIMLKKSGRPIVLCVNKVDSTGNLPADYYEFFELGFEYGPIAVSSVHGSGTGDLLDEVTALLPDQTEQDEGGGRIRVAVIGKPNSGKSSLVNRLLGENRLIVSNIAGTTRDAIDTEVDNESGSYTFIDTAGIRRQSKVEDRIEKYSVLRAKLAVERADVCLIMIDANEGVTEQDEKIAGIAHEEGKASIIVINKWDIIEKDDKTTKQFTDKVYTALSYMTYAPIVFISALTGQRVNRLFPMINNVLEQSRKRVTTGMLNDLLADAIARVQPPSDKGRYLKIYYMTQTEIAPPTFVVFCNRADLFHFSYQRYIENCLRETFGFDGTPIKLIIREKAGDNGKKDGGTQL